MLSVVMPTLNAADTLRASLEAVKGGALAGEIVVVDGGSNDGTTAIAECFEPVVMFCEPGRGQQLATGAAAARFEWFLFLHGDCVLEPDWPDAVKAFIEDPESVGRAAYFQLRFDDSRWNARALEWIVSRRSKWLGLPYGDQGLLINRALYEETGGFKKIPIMEDVEFVRRIGKARLRELPSSIVTSARRYRRRGYWIRPLQNLLCLSLYFCRIPPRMIARLYGL